MASRPSTSVALRRGWVGLSIAPRARTTVALRAASEFLPPNNGDAGARSQSIS